jgi:4-hydroxyphenylacetate 3-monooxygenase
MARVKTGADHLKALRDGREIYIDGEKVTNHVDHPSFRNAVRAAASLYDLNARPDSLEKMTFESPTSGNRVSRCWQLPTSYGELVERRKAIEAWAEQTCGWLGRSPDHVASSIGAMYMGIDLFEAHGAKRAAAVRDYYHYAMDRDLYTTFAITSPQADRGKDASQQVDEFVVAGVCDEDHEGVTVRGTRMLATAAPMAEELMLASIQPLKPGEDKYGITAMLPMNTKGLKLFSRKSYEGTAVSEFDNPLSTHFDENDCMVYFDDVKIPWERVFVHNNAKMSADIWHAIPVHVMHNYPCQVRLMVKMRFLLGLARRIAETNGVINLPQVRDTLGLMAAETGMVEGMVKGMEANGKQYGKYFIPDRKLLYSAMVLTQQLYPQFVLRLRDLSGGGMIMLPSSDKDFANPAIAPYIEKTQKSPVTDGKGRVKLFKLAWDAVGSEFGGRHTQYEMFYAGATFVARGHAFRTYEWDKALDLVDRFMESYDLPATPAKASRAL